MKVRVRGLGVGVFVLLFLAGCGDLKTPRELQNLRNREQIQQRVAELKPLVGEYEGTMLNARSQRQERLRLNIVLAGEVYDGDNIPDETIAPTLRASLILYANESATATYIIIPFNRSDYDAKNKSLKFYEQAPDGVLLIQGIGDTLRGSWSNSSRGLIGEFEASRVRALKGEVQ